MNYGETALSKATYVNVLQIDHWYFKIFKIATHQNDHKSVAFLMHICWKLLLTSTIFIR